MATTDIQNSNKEIDTTNSDKDQAMEIAEDARQSEWEHPSFAKQLFMGKFDKSMLSPFPEQSEAEKKIGDDFVEKMITLLKEHLDPEKVDETRTIPQSVMDKMAGLGAFAMKIPKEYGGLGFSQVNYNRVILSVASYCSSTAVLLSAHQSIGVPQPLNYFGTKEQKEKYLPEFRKGAISGFALTEVGVGSDPAQIASTAVLSDDGSYYTINGEKLWCSNGPIADYLVIMVQTESETVKGKEKKQITAFILEKSMEGIEVTHRCDFMGIRGIQNGLIKFTNVKVPVENIIWGKGLGLKLALITLNTGRLTLPAAGTGMAKQCLNIARNWGNERKQWGLPIGLHEAGRAKIAFIASTTFAMEALTWITSHWADQKNIDIRIEAAMAKLFCSELGWSLVDETLQLRGGRGFEKASSLEARGEKPYPVERMLRDSRINRIIEGTTEIMRLFLAREALDPHLKLAGPLLKKSTPFGVKFKTYMKLALFYGQWYPRQWINFGLLSFHGEMGPLKNHYRFIERTGHKLARKIFQKIMRYQDKLERKQNTLARLIEIGTELFAMSTVCAYAKHLSEKDSNSQSVMDLANTFCLASRQRIEGHFLRLKKNNDKVDNRLAKTVLNGDLKWLEKGAIPIVKDYEEL